MSYTECKALYILLHRAIKYKHVHLCEFKYSRIGIYSSHKHYIVLYIIYKITVLRAGRLNTVYNFELCTDIR